MTSTRSLIRRAALAGTCAAGLVAPGAHAGTHTVVYSFGTGGDGSGPAAAMADASGTLYGTTVGGGSSSVGTIFQISKGVETLVYSFKGGASDGATPKASVLSVGGTLYGTTEYGGSTTCSGGCGTVYGVSTAGTETMLYKFQGGSDGANPTAGLANVGSTLYGTTYYGGGTNNYGTVFAISPGGTESVLYAFNGGSDGANPMGGLLKVGSTLYGTTYTGGSSYYGTVFSLTTAGVKKTLYSFKNGSDGAYPQSSLVNIGKTLYGLSLYGTNHVGTVYSLSLKGTFKTLYSFKGGTDGSDPQGSLVNVKGTLYGTTYSGGSTTACSGYGCGTVFSVTPKKTTETVVYAFQGGSDGLDPEAGLTSVKGAIYGTTAQGGAYYNGTVFQVVP